MSYLTTSQFLLCSARMVRSKECLALCVSLKLEYSPGVIFVFIAIDKC